MNIKQLLFIIFLIMHSCIVFVPLKAALAPAPVAPMPVVIVPPPAPVLPAVLPVPVYVPMAVVGSSLILSDQRMAFGAPSNNNGAITSTLNGNRSSYLQEEYLIISSFEALQGPGYVACYQNNISRAINETTPLAMQVILAYENVIMHIYLERSHAVRFSYLPFSPIQGIRIRGFFGDNIEQDQLIAELNQLANIAMSKAPLTGQRIKATVFLYRHWRTIAVLSTLFFLFKNIGNNEIKDTFIYSLVHGDIKKIVRWKTLGKYFDLDIKKIEFNRLKKLGNLFKYVFCKGVFRKVEKVAPFKEDMFYQLQDYIINKLFIAAKSLSPYLDISSGYYVDSGL